MTNKQRNYQTPTSVIRALVTKGFIKPSDSVTPYAGCYCRDCRLVRKAYKIAGVEVKNHR